MYKLNLLELKNHIFLGDWECTVEIFGAENRRM
jgi:hypothetical protein